MPKPIGYAQTYGYGANTSVARSSAPPQSRAGSITARASVDPRRRARRQHHRRVVSVTQVSPRSNGMVRVRGLASSGRYAYNGYGPYGVGAYGALGYSYANAADLRFRCDVGPNGAVYNVSINRR